ncbi:mucin-2 [Weissella oryzae SG25]|uniref:Mucin-2 n=1 Tax=Weissella oryzae (strain DSM 25784 / JCM 18191 / LMG 30913 / SG25) TaxID=1329250 RepID=A0A069D0L2_WEIOS|nr:Fic family protein [Weissella oryzae]GAK30851.1 mucin-2 [Weissella oryzae SG25]
MQQINDKKMGLLFYSVGRFEGLQADAGSTIDFVKANNTVVLPSQIDMTIIYALKAAWCAIEPNDGKVTVADFEKVHTNLLMPKGILEVTEVQTATHNKTMKNVKAIVSETLFAEKIAEALSGGANLYEKAARLFATIVKLHPFTTGNKQTAIIVVNRLLLADDEVLLIPYTDSEYQKFMANLEDFIANKVTLTEFGSYYGTYVRKLNNLEITRPFGKIIDLTTQDKAAF